MHRHVDRADFLEHAPNRRKLAIALAAGGIDDVQRQVRFGHLFERRAEGGHERVRQPIDEPDRVRDQQLAPIRKANLANERVERDEQRVGDHGRSLVSRLNSVVLPAFV